MALITNKDGSTRFFECDPDDGGCGKFTLTADVNGTKVHTHCKACGYDNWATGPVGLTNPSGSASFVGIMTGMAQ